MNVSKADFNWAASQGLLSTEQADDLWLALQSRPTSRSRFDLAHVLYYFGALIVISAMTWFMTLGWAVFGGGGLFLIASLYALCFVLAGRILWNSKDFKVPGGLLFTIAVCMTPLAIYGLESLTGIWPQGEPRAYQDYYVRIKGGWFLIEVGTIIAGLICVRFIHFPFLIAPVTFSLWYMSMDLTPLLFGKTDFSWDERRLVSLCFGLVVWLVSYLVDRRTQQDYAFWGYLFGMLSFWFGLTLLLPGDHLQKIIYCLINIVLIFASVFLQRRIFVVFGALGVFGYLSYLAYDIFASSVVFPFALTFIGLIIIALGIMYQRNRAMLERLVYDMAPGWLRRLLPTERVRA